MTKKIHCPTADELSLLPRRAPSRRAALAEARELALWARKRIPMGSAAEILTHGHHTSYDEDVNLADLDLAIAMIVARVREDATAKVEQKWYHPGNRRAVLGEIEFMDANWNGVPLKSRKMARKSGKCGTCGTEFVDDTPAFAPGPAKATRKQWAAAVAAALREKVPKGSGFNPRAYRQRKAKA